MTQPQLPTAPHPDVLALEQYAVGRITKGLRRALELAAQRITALYVKLAGGLDRPLPEHLRRAYADGVALILAQVQFDEQDDLWTMTLAALAAGARSTGLMPIAEDAIRPQVEQWIGTLVQTIADRIMAVLASARAAPHIGSPPRNYNDATFIISLAYRALSMAERDTRWAINGAHNQGVLEVVNEAEVDRVWVAEQDACLHCLAYSGEVARPFQPYRSGLTYYVDPRGNLKPVHRGVVWGPPLHPNCRCSQEPYLGSFEYQVMPWETGETSVAEALKREARRTVLKGDSGTDSQPARLRAASALLAVGAGLPKSVEAKARAAVRAGAFK